MSNDSPPSDEDLIFLREAMRGVRPIKRSLVAREASKKYSRFSPLLQSSKKKEVYRNTSMSLLILADPVEQTILPEDKLFFRRQGPPNKVIKQLIRGDIARVICLDLHGMTVEQARQAVTECLLGSQKAGLRCVQIIHGKGQSSQTKAKLKNYVNCWLTQFPGVLAFVSAPASDGGTGAVYVLLAASSKFSKTGD